MASTTQHLLYGWPSRLPLNELQRLRRVTALCGVVVPVSRITREGRVECSHCAHTAALLLKRFTRSREA